MPRFYCERWSGLSIWAHALRRMIAFQGGYFNTTDPTEVAFIRSTDYFQRGLIIEQPISMGVSTGPMATRSTPASPHALEGSAALPDPLTGTASHSAQAALS